MNEIFRAVFANIMVNKFRVFLTALGIIVGSLTIILVVGIGKGSQASVEEQFAKLNVGTIYVMSLQGSTANVALTMDDLKAIQENSSSIKDSTISINGKAPTSYLNNSLTGSVSGVTDNFMALNNLKLTQGEFISPGDSESLKKVAVVGSDLAETLFGEDLSEAVGKAITINKRKFEVIGVLARLGDTTQGINLDESVLVPYNVASKYVLGTSVKPRIIALASDVDHVASAIDEITTILNERYKGKFGMYFQVRDAGSKLVAAQDSANTMSVLLIAVAAIVLIVGGIGIMNVLFVSIKERTKEIGILKAIGARRRDILLQFLLESVIISASGGLVGIGLSFAVLPLMGYLDLRVIPSMYGNVLAMVFAVATGTFFGYYPAAKASRLRPIDALTYE